MTRLNSLVAKTFPATERAGDRVMREISPFKMTSASWLLANLKSAVLLKLFDHGIGNQHFDAWNQRVVFKRRDGNRVHIAKIIRFDRTDVIAEASGQAKASTAARTNFFTAPATPLRQEPLKCQTRAKPQAQNRVRRLATRARSCYWAPERPAVAMTNRFPARARGHCYCSKRQARFALALPFRPASSGYQMALPP